MKTYLKNISAILFGFSLYFVIQFSMKSYEHTKSHPTVNETIIQKFHELNKSSDNPEELKNYFFTFYDSYEKLKGMALTNPGYLEGTTSMSEKSWTAIEWIKHGGYSADEPELQAAVRHFYDPTKPAGSRYLTNRGTYWEGVYPNPRTDAIEWAIGDSPKSANNPFTLQVGKNNMILAFTTKDSALRNEHFAAAYKCLGEVLHNTADMGCPPHTRNDSHAAPLGYAGGWILGSPDPYEELFSPAVDSANKDNNTDPSLQSYFESATTIRQINEKMAEFTNKNFFTNETINGIGVKEYKSINSDGRYSAPKLEDLEYMTESFNFEKTFPSGNRIILARDQSYFRFRGYPYIDKKAAHSQAKELVPNIMCAGVNVMRLFFPKVEIEMIDIDPLSDSIEINVKHIRNDEYPNTFLYEGPISFIINNKIHDSVLVIEKGKFKGILPFYINNGDKIKAFISMPGFTIYQEKELINKMDPLWGVWEIKEVLEDSNDPAAPVKGTIFSGIKFFRILTNGMIKITNLDGSGLMQLNYERNNLSFKISGASSKQSYSQQGNVINGQMAWSGQTASTYKVGTGGNEVEYFRKYTSNGERPKIKVIQKVKEKLSYDVR